MAVCSNQPPAIIFQKTYCIWFFHINVTDKLYLLNLARMFLLICNDTTAVMPNLLILILFYKENVRLFLVLSYLLIFLSAYNAKISRTVHDSSSSLLFIIYTFGALIVQSMATCYHHEEIRIHHI
jgi:hypothetical protein